LQEAMKLELEHATADELVRLYEDAAIRHGRGTEEGTPKATNQAANTISAVYRELRRRGGQTRDAILPLLLSDHASVRGWAASHALEFAPERGRAILQNLAKERGLIAFSARMTLKVWNEGTLRFP
jgi:hypothetical protein